MRLFTPRRSGSTSLLEAGESGFTLAEMVVVVAIVALTTAWAVPQFTRGIEQNKVDNYVQILHTGLFNLLGAIITYFIPSLSKIYQIIVDIK